MQSVPGWVQKWTVICMPPLALLICCMVMVPKQNKLRDVNKEIRATEASLAAYIKQLKAISDLKEVAEEAPTPAHLFHLARAHHAAHDRDSAVKALRQARQGGLKPNELHPVEQDACRKLLAELNVH